MKIQVQSDTDFYSGGIIIPLGKNDQLKAGLQAIATEFELNPELLIIDFQAGHKEILVLQGRHQKQTDVRLYLLGLGDNPGFAQWLQAFRSLSHKWGKKLSEQLSISFLHNNLPTHVSQAVEAAANGLLLGTYQIGRFQQEKPKPHPLLRQTAILRWHLPDGQNEEVEPAATRGKTFAETQLRIFELVNAPSNHKTPAHLSAWAVRSGEEFGYSVRVLEKNEIEMEHLHGLLAVNRGSEHPATFNILEYKPEGTPITRVGLVGKGVTFDTGGLSIKPSTNMHLMKSDMGGAAAVFGAVEMAARLQLPVHLIGIVPATDNSVDALSIKPSDVIASHSGKHIEVIDTDAEGRLILADGLSYMVTHYQPDTLIDLATLTGSVIRALGYAAAGLFGNADNLNAELLAAGQRTGERLWPFPLWKEYGDMMRSDMADVKNFSGKPIAGAITAAKFLEHFIHDHPRWAHLDIAGVAMSDTEHSMERSATAFGIRLLIEFLENIKSGAGDQEE